MIEAIVLFIFGLVLLIRGGDWFVDSACDVAHRFRMPEILIGATIVSIGTTLPEVMVSAQSAAIGQGGMAYGNAIGSIICNTALIAALTVAIRPPEIKRKEFVLPVIFFFVAAIVYLIAAYFLGRFSLAVGIILLVIFVVYMVITIVSAIRSGKKESELVEGIEPLGSEQTEQTEQEENSGEGSGWNVFTLIRDVVLLVAALCCFILSMIKKAALVEIVAAGVAAVCYVALTAANALIKKPCILGGGDKPRLVKSIAFLIIGAAIIALGANLLVNNGTLLAQKIGVPDTVIGLTFVAIGTSLPELVTAVTSLIKKHGSLSLGNIIGANLFNLVLVSGVSIVISPFDVPSEKLLGGFNSSLVLDLPVMLFVMMLLTLPAIIRGKLSRVQGITLLCIYAAFFAVQFAI